ncbi:hypothetical protein PA598K_04814 [Paenibacillus sp. 598K]|uniref:DUF262 domain-containing protein n=1 Tax=Paenibacillus sp. 598K TaxID=1117987 RepID=UPI000FFA9456|nr:DUF262 domain-containing protein [Paenibacillus sp. 598K]GBF76351.1 hypothetical protein PA598K_04814 [Paenibacillus sp. 598K]
MNDNSETRFSEEFTEEQETDKIFEYDNSQDIDIYPDATIKVEREQYSIYELKRKFSKELIILDPEFQRKYVWGTQQQSELIESVLMGIPLPLFYLNETKDGKLVVVDGLQRLTTFFKFLDNEFKLQDLKILNNINDCYFSQLGEAFQSKLEDYQIIAQVIKPPTPERIKFDIFDRVNRGGTRLNQQEMRNALYQGKATKLLKDLAESKAFLEATDNSITKDRMKDRYMILRMVAFYLWRTNKLLDANGNLLEYRTKELDEFLGKAMERINAMRDEDITKVRSVFLLSMENNLLLFGNKAFRRTNGERRYPVNLILFESFGYLFSHFRKEVCNDNKTRITVRVNELMNDDSFKDLLSTDRGRGVVIPQIFNKIDQLKEEFQRDFAADN